MNFIFGKALLSLLFYIEYPYFFTTFSKFLSLLFPYFSVDGHLKACSLSLAFFYRFSSNLARELILGRSVLGLQMGKFWQISTELRPLIDIRNWFSLFIFGNPLPIFFKLGMRVDIGKECPGIANG